MSPNVEELASQATFIFEGAILRLNASTVAAAPASDATLVVRVEAILKAPAMLSGYTGREITVQLPRRRALPVGSRAVFYTVGWLYAESLAVRAVGVRPVARTTARQRQRVAASAETRADIELRDRVRDADLVVTGRVVETRAAPQRNVAIEEGPEAGRLTEHDPRWAEAVIEVSEVVKGTTADPQITVPYATSDDVSWYQAPKFTAGQEGVFLLHTAPVVAGRAMAEPVPLQPLDVQPMAQLERIRAIAGQG